MTNTDKMLTLQEIADYMGVTKKTVALWIKQNELTAFRLEKTFRVKETEFQRFLDAHTIKE